MIAQLIPLKGGNPITLVDDITIVGRQRDVCDLVVDSKSVSKMHCILIKTDGLLYVRDLSSTNGTRVNGQRITRGALLPGDRLDFASEKFKVHLGPDGAEIGGPVDRTEMIVTPHDPDADTPRPRPGQGSHVEPFR
jgi:pSer/pThr/pTyr-binding forkhead associated (FHA) protein